MTIPFLSKPISSLFLPPNEEEILVRGEEVYYCQRKHWASLIESALETLSVYVLVAFVIRFLAITGIVPLVLLVGSLYGVVRLLGLFEWSRTKLVVGVAAVALAAFVFGVPGTAFLAAVIATGRMVHESAQWAFFEYRFVTNRRVMESRGFFGYKVSIMPLARVTDVSFTRTAFGELFGYGVLRLESAGQDQALGRLEYITDPDRFYEALILLSPGSAGGEAPKPKPQ